MGDAAQFVYTECDFGGAVFPDKKQRLNFHPSLPVQGESSIRVAGDSHNEPRCVASARMAVRVPGVPADKQVGTGIEVRCWLRHFGLARGAIVALDEAPFQVVAQVTILAVMDDEEAEVSFRDQD